MNVAFTGRYDIMILQLSCHIIDCVYTKLWSEQKQRYQQHLLLDYKFASNVSPSSPILRYDN